MRKFVVNNCVTHTKNCAMSVKFYLEKRPNKKGEFPIRAEVCISQTRYLTTIGYSVESNNWNQSSQKVKPKTTNSKKVSGSVANETITGIQNHFLRYENRLDGHRPSLDEIKEQFDIATGKKKENAIVEEKKEKTILDRFDEFVKEEGRLNQWTVGTHECWHAFRGHLAKLGKNVKYSFFDERGIKKFIEHLRNDCGMEEKTVQKHYGNLRWYLNWAVRKGYCKESEVSKYKPKFKVIEKPVIFLTKEELLKLYNYKIPANGVKVKLRTYEGEEYEKTVHDAGALEKTRDCFCFCAFTSLRYSDMAKLKRTDIAGDYIYVVTAKTNDRLPINLNSFAKAILDKYEDQRFANGIALPVISNQKMNEYIKDLCELCGFNEPITRVCYRGGERQEETTPKYELIGTHAGRRTFICFALSSGIPPQVVMKWTGHSDYKAMKPYIDIAEKTKAQAMNVFEDALKK